MKNTSARCRLVSLTIWCFILLALGLGPQTARADYTVPANQQWWSDARFGMFIHFGSYSYWAQGEWNFNSGWTKQGYQESVSKPFNPVNFNATDIATLAKNAGMKYIVITSKHHEGYAMWPRTATGFRSYDGSKIYSLSDWSGFTGRDLLGELKTACDNADLKFCLYYSILDWNHPSQEDTHIEGLTKMASMTARANYIADMKADLAELINRYHPAVLWFDGDWFQELGAPTLEQWWQGADGQDLYDYLKNLDPNLVINERVKRDLGLGDFACAEAGVPGAPMNRPWETNITMNGAWGYNAAAETTKSYRTAKELIQQLIQVVSREGNYLLNIGPDEDGDVTPLSRDRLQGIAAWTSINNRMSSIRGTTRSPFGSEPAWGYYTKKDGYLYCHVLNWQGATLSVPRITNTITRIYTLDNPGASLSYTLGSTLNITTPSKAPDSIDSIVVIECAGVPMAMPDMVANGTYQLVAKHSGDAAKPIGSTAGSLAQTFRYSNRDTAFRWTVTNLGNGQYSIVNTNTNKPLSVVGESTADGANLAIDNASASNFQKWTITSLGGGYYKLINVGSGKAMDVYHANTADGSQMIQWPWNGADNQQWQFLAP